MTDIEMLEVLRRREQRLITKRYQAERRRQAYATLFGAVIGVLVVLAWLALASYGIGNWFWIEDIL